MQDSPLNCQIKLDGTLAIAALEFVSEEENEIPMVGSNVEIPSTDEGSQTRSQEQQSQTKRQEEECEY